MRADRYLRRLSVGATLSLWSTAVLAGFVQPILTPSPVPLSFPSQEVGKTSPPSTET